MTEKTFMLYGNACLIYKFDITKRYFEKIIKNDGSQNFHIFVDNEILYPDPTKRLPVIFTNQTSAIEKAIFARVQRKYPIALGKQSMLILAKNTGPWNIFVMPELCRDQKVLQKLGHIECHIIVSFLEINDAYLNLNTLYEFECEKAVVTTF